MSADARRNLGYSALLEKKAYLQQKCAQRASSPPFYSALRFVDSARTQESRFNALNCLNKLDRGGSFARGLEKAWPSSVKYLGLRFEERSVSV